MSSVKRIPVKASNEAKITPKLQKALVAQNRGTMKSSWNVHAYRKGAPIYSIKVTFHPAVGDLLEF